MCVCVCVFVCARDVYIHSRLSEDTNVQARLCQKLLIKRINEWVVKKSFNRICYIYIYMCVYIVFRYI